jgi:hypothetical protein
MVSAKESVAKNIVDDASRDTDVEFWHTADGRAYLSIKTGLDNHLEHHPLRDRRTRQWLAAKYYNNNGIVISSSTLSDIINVLEGHAQDGPTYEVFIRVAGADGAIYIDLANAAWDAVKITADGWNVVKNPPIKFRRTNGMLPLPGPVPGGSLDEDLRPLLNADSDQNWLLMKGWLLGLLIPTGPHPILALRGEQDTAKSYTQKLLRSIIDPSTLPIRRPAKRAEDLMIAANNNWVVSFDNMSKIGDELSDDLCCVATGGGIAKRTQYTNTDETILQVCRPIIMNGIENIITRPDLLDRSIYITLPQIPAEKRSPEAKLLTEFEEKKPKILGALLDAAVIALQNEDRIVLNDPYRMAGFVKFAAAGLGDEGDKFQAVYKNNRDFATAEVIADNFLFVRLKELIPQYCHSASFMKQEPCWKGNATALLDYLKHGLDESKATLLPKRANVLSGDLQRLAPSLRKEGIEVRKEGARKWVIGIVK